MHGENRTVVGIFSDITNAKRATDELHSKGILTARLIENELALTFTGTAEREGSNDADPSLSEHSGGGGIKGFFARLFGLNGDRPSWKLSSDSETYFQNAYDKKHHLVIIDDCSDIALSRDIIARMGGVSEEQGSHYYHSEKRSQRSQTLMQDSSASSSEPGISADQGQFVRRDPGVDPGEPLGSGRHLADDQAADSGLGVDVDRMPFAHPAHHENSAQGSHVSVSNRISQSKVSGTADHLPVADAPSLNWDDDLSLEGKQNRSGDSNSETEISIPPEYLSFGGQASGNSQMTHAHPEKDRDYSFRDRALDGVSGDADRTPLVGHLSGNRRPDSIIIGDDRVHDRGVSNADVARISSDRIMEWEDDQKLADTDEGDVDRVIEDDPQDESHDNGHILPQRSYPHARGENPVPPAP